MRAIFRSALISSLLLLASDCRPQQAARHWVSAWMCAPQRMNDEPTAGVSSSEGLTLREVVRVSLGGASVRVRFANTYGDAPLTIGAASVALASSDGAVVPGSVRPLTFHGSSTIAIPPGAEALSDPAPLPTTDFASLSVSMYLPHPTAPATGHVVANATSYAAPGNQTAQTQLDAARAETEWDYLSGVEVLAGSRDSAIVVLGDSISDGLFSTRDANARWTDELALRLAGRKGPRYAVLNAAISGNRLLHDGDGQSALARFDRDVLAASGVRTVIVLEGINDLGGVQTDEAAMPAADNAIWALDQIAQRAHAHGMRVVAGTLLPYRGAGYFSAAGEAARQAVNAWIRGSASFDGVADFDRALRDPAHPDALLPVYDHGDHLHPNDAGYKAMGDAIDLNLLVR
jgi:lysophospholipase L1-like esterase